MTTISTTPTSTSEFNDDCAPLSASKIRDAPELVEIVFSEDIEDSDDSASECSSSPKTPEQPSEI